MEAGGGAFNLGVASSPQEGRRKKTRRAGRKRKDARHRKVAEKRSPTRRPIDKRSTADAVPGRGRRCEGKKTPQRPL